MGKAGVTAAARGFWPIIRRIFTIGVFTIIFFFILINSIIDSIEQRSVRPLVEEVGGRFILISAQFVDHSNEVISDSYDSLGFWDKLKLSGTVFLDLYVIFIWMKLLTFIVANTPIHGDKSRTPVNVTIAFGIFIGLQIILILLSVTYDLTPQYDGIDALGIPFKIFTNLWYATPKMIEPIISFGGNFNEIRDITPMNNSNLSLNSSS